MVTTILFRLLPENMKIKIYKTTISPVVLYICETCCLELKITHKLSVFENIVLTGIFGPKKKVVRKTEGWRKWHKEEIHNLHSSPSNIMVVKSTTMKREGAMRNAHKILVKKSEERNHLRGMT
jgi:hypothetical protein